MTSIVALFGERPQAEAACDLLTGAGYTSEDVTMLSPHAGDAQRPLLHTGESILRSALRWGVIGALALELPTVVAMLVIPVDVTVKVLLLASVWKLGAAFGAWLGGMSGSDRGIDEDMARDYQAQLLKGRWIVAAAVRRPDRMGARGIMIESSAIEVRDVRGTLELRPQGFRARDLVLARSR